MLSKAYALNCSCFATGAQNTLYIQKKKERAKINHPWPHFLAIPNLPVQFCPFPVYPGWQSHECDPLVLVQFASSWQEWFPLHSSMSMKSQIKKKMGYRNYAKIVVHKPLPCLKSASCGCFQSFSGLREREIVVPDEKKLSTQKTYLLITFLRLLSHLF